MNLVTGCEKPFIHGVQSAIVTGPAGKDLWCDQYGRVKVHFPWDRYHPYDETSSCWIRVSEPWAGGQQGQRNVPRIGQEVLVSYEQGDPDRPIIVGRVTHELNKPSWQLPSQSAISGIRSRELKGGGAGNSAAGRWVRRARTCGWGFGMSGAMPS